MQLVKPILGARLKQDDPIASSCIRAWTMNENNGPNIYDAASNYTGTKSGSGIAWDTGKLDWNNSTNYMTCGLLDLANFKELSISFGYRLDSLSNDAYFVGNYLASTACVYIVHQVFGGAGAIRIGLGTTVAIQQSSPMTGYTTGEHNVVFTYKNGSLISYYKGGYKSTDSFGSTMHGTKTSIPLRLGTLAAVPGNAFNGAMHYLQIYNRALTPCEVKKISYDPYCIYYRPKISLIGGFSSVLGPPIGSLSMFGLGV